VTEPTDNSTVYTIDELRDIILPYVRRRRMKSASVFGSYARGEADGNSDIDILVDKGDNRFLALGGLAEEVFARTGKRPDVIDVSQLLPGSFRDQVLREAVTL
jgi:predicted nucleotidyltransferase